MEVTKSQLAVLKRFKDNLETYQEIAIFLYKNKKDHQYVSESNLNELTKQEKMLRLKLNIDYGNIENLLDNLLGGKPYIGMPAMPGMKWNVYSEALASNFNFAKGECLNFAVDATNRAFGKAKAIISSTVKSQTNSVKPPLKSGKPPKSNMVISKWFPEDLLARINDNKVKVLCIELDQVLPLSPNAAALLMRTILLNTLQQKIGGRAKDDLGPVLGQAIALNVYSDRHIMNILSGFSTIPKSLLDATHHSKWMLIGSDHLGHWMPGLVKVIEATYPAK